MSLVTTLLEAPTKLGQFIDACTCGRTDKETVNAIRAELEAKDRSIERLEADIRRKDAEKDNLLDMQRDLQVQITAIRQALDAQAFESDDALRAAVAMQKKARGIFSRKRVHHLKGDVQAAGLGGSARAAARADGEGAAELLGGGGQRPARGQARKGRDGAGEGGPQQRARPRARTGGAQVARPRVAAAAVAG